jgi:hypothetical protein
MEHSEKVPLYLPLAAMAKLKVGELESWGVGKLEGWKVGELERRWQETENPVESENRDDFFYFLPSTSSPRISLPSTGTCLSIAHCPLPGAFTFGF